MQTAIVFLIVAAAAAYAAWQLMPQGLRRWLLDRLIVVAPRGASCLLRLRESAESSGCSSCKACRENMRVSAPPAQAGTERQGRRING